MEPETAMRPEIPFVLRLFVPAPLAAGSDIALPPGATRHAQVRRVQPGDTLLLFNGDGSERPAEVLRVGRGEVWVRPGLAVAVARELPVAVTLALGMPANERMDTLVEKATELGVARIQPLLCERSVLRLAGERAQRKQAHWQAIAESACEQCGRARVPMVEPVRALTDWLNSEMVNSNRARAASTQRLLLSLRLEARPLAELLLKPLLTATAVCTLSGPEGGLTAAEEAAALAAGFMLAALGPRVLRADTAPLAVLAWIGLQHGPAAAG